MHRKKIRNVGIALLVGCGFLATMMIGSGYVLATYKGAQYKCIVEGPQPDGAQWKRILAPGEAYEAAVPMGSFALLPIGRACDYVLAAGGGSVRLVSGDWGQTALAGVFVAGSLAGAVIIAATRDT